MFCIRSTRKCIQTFKKINDLFTSPTQTSYLQTQTLTSSVYSKSFSQVTPISVPIYMENYNFTTKPLNQTPETQTTKNWTGSKKTTPQTKIKPRKNHIKMLPYSKNHCTKTGGKK